MRRWPFSQPSPAIPSARSPSGRRSAAACSRLRSRPWHWFASSSERWRCGCPLSSPPERLLTFALLSRGEIACQVIRLRLRPYPLKAKAFIENQRGEGELVPFVRPQALTFEEIPYLIGQYERAARNTEAADFDGVEIHAANGYLIDQFIETKTNKRRDASGDANQTRGAPAV